VYPEKDAGATRPLPWPALAGLEAVIVLAAYTTYPKAQSIASLSRLTGFTRKTVAAAVRMIDFAGQSQLKWFDVKQLSPENL
jgi:hypothetical protein